MQDKDQQIMTEIAASWAQSQFEISGYISALVPDYHDAQDVIQRTAVTVVQKYHQYDRTRPFRNWAVGVARLEVLKYREQRAHEKILFSQALIDQISQIFTEESSDKHDTLQALRQCLKQVQGKNRQALSMWYAEQRKAEEIARWLGIKTNALYVMMSRLRGNLRDCVKRRLTCGEGT